ncbi:hypothetical protein [Streptomyces sp. NPDC006552]
MTLPGGEARNTAHFPLPVRVTLQLFRDTDQRLLDGSHSHP